MHHRIFFGNTFHLKNKLKYLNEFAEESYIKFNELIYTIHAPCGESMSLRILYVTDIEGTRMTFTVNNGTNTTQIPSTSNHAQIS
jgi:hypothetical protein